MYCVYRLTNLVNGKSYIGRTAEDRLSERMRRHRRKDSPCPKICNAIQKHGWDQFRLDILESGLSADKVVETENRWLESEQPEYNCITSKNGQVVFSDETRRKLSEAHKGRKASLVARRNMSIATMGQERTVATRQKLSAINTGKRHSRVVRDRISVKTAEGRAGMPILSLYIRLQLCKRAGWSQIRIAETFRMCRKTVRKYLNTNPLTL